MPTDTKTGLLTRSDVVKALKERDSSLKNYPDDTLLYEIGRDYPAIIRHLVESGDTDAGKFFPSTDQIISDVKNKPNVISKLIPGGKSAMSGYSPGNYKVELPQNSTPLNLVTSSNVDVNKNNPNDINPFKKPSTVSLQSRIPLSALPDAHDFQPTEYIDHTKPASIGMGDVQVHAQTQTPSYTQSKLVLAAPVTTPPQSYVDNISKLPDVHDFDPYTPFHTVESTSNNSTETEDPYNEFGGSIKKAEIDPYAEFSGKVK